MRGIALEGEHEERLVAAVVQLRQEDGPIHHKAGLVQLIVIAARRRDGVRAARGAGIAEVLIGHALVGIRVQVGVLEDGVGGPVQLVGPVPHDHVGHGSVAVTNLRVEDGGTDLDLLNGLGRRGKAGVGRA